MLKSILLIAFWAITAPALASEQTVYAAKEITCSPQDDIYYCVTSRDGKPVTGTVKSYTKGELDQEEHYLDGKLNGSQKFYREGKLAEERSYKNGQLYGVSKRYYPSGKLEYRANFRGDRRNGYIITFDESGRPVYKIYRSNGKERIVPAQRNRR